MGIAAQKKSQFHPNRKREVLATADVSLQQAQVIDSKGEIKAIFVWRCGPDILFSENMEGMFDRDRRHAAPKWLRQQLESLPPSRQFDCFGSAKGASTDSPSPTAMSSSVGVVPDGMEDEETDGFSQA